MEHREVGKLLFRKDSTSLEKLGLTAALPRPYLEWLEIVKNFYSVAQTDSAIQEKLSTVLITPNVTAKMLQLVEKVETDRVKYVGEEAESQDATDMKDIALADLEDYMIDFYGYAEIALKDHPQLLEALGIIVKR